MPRVKQRILQNGLKVLTKKISAMPVVSVFLWYRVGARNESKGQSGLAHFLEHMLFKGTAAFPQGDISRLIERTGGQQNAFTSYDYTAYYETVPSEHLELVLRIQADRMSNALLDPREVHKERSVILSELDGNKNHPHVRFRDLMNAQTWINHPYRRPVIGWKEEVEKLSREQLVNFYRAHYTPSNAVLVVVGDYEEKILAGYVKKHFSGIARGQAPAQPCYPAELAHGLNQVVMEDHGPAPMVQVNLLIPPAGHKDHFALSVLSDVLAKGKTARLYRSLVDRGLATDVYASPYEMIDPGVWTFRAICQNAVHPQQVEEVFLKEFATVREQLIRKHECVKAVNQTRAQLVFSKDSITDQALMLGFYETVAKDWRIPERYLQAVAKVTPKQLQEVAGKYLIPANMTIGRFFPHGVKMKTVPLKALKAKSCSIATAAPTRSRQAPVRTSVAGKKMSRCHSEKFSHGCTKYILSNQATLLVHPNPGNPMVVLSGLVQGGVVAEPQEKPGMALMHAHMLDRGSLWRDANKIAADLEFKGTQLLYTARREELQITGETLCEDLPLMFRVLGENFIKPVFPEIERHKAGQEILAVCHSVRQNSDMQAWQHFYEMAYPAGHPMRRSLLTAAKGIPKMTRQDLLAYHQAAISPEKAIFSIAGDVEPEKVRQLMEKYLGQWQSSGNQSPDYFNTALEMAPVMKSKGHIHRLPGKHESIVVLGHQGLHRDHPDYYPAFVANQILGGAGLSSLLMQEVRDRAGLTYSIYSQFRVSRGNRPWCIVFQTEPEKVDAAVKIALEQIRRLQTGRIKRHLLIDTQERLAGGLAMGMETNTGIAYLNREIEYHQLGKDYIAEYARRIRAVTFKQMTAAARKWFHPDKYLLSIAAPEK